MAKVSKEEIEAGLGFGQDTPEAKSEDKTKDKKEEDKPKEDEDPDEDGKKQEEKKEGITEEKKDTDAEKKDDDKKAEEEDKDKTKEVDPIIADEVIAKALEDKYEISSYKDLVETLEGVDALVDAHEKVIAENKKLKEAKPELEFQSDSQKKVYEFLTKTGYDPSKIGEGILTHAKLITMDLSKDADPKMILEEAFVIDHPELTREEARIKFERKYKNEYTVDKAKFDDDKDYNEEVQHVEIDKKTAVAKATEFLKKKQSEFKPDEKEGKKEVAEVKLTKEVDDGIKRTVAGFRKYMDGLETLTFTDEKNPSNTFTYSVPKRTQKQVLEAGTNWLSKAELYNEKGEIPSNHNAEEYAHNVTMSLVWRDVVEKMLRHTDQKAAIITAERIAEKKPERKGGAEKGSLEGLDFMASAELLADQKVKERKAQGR